MPTRILKADSVRISAFLPIETGFLSDPEPVQLSKSTSKESEMIIAETKLLTCQLLNDAKRQAEAIIAEATGQAAQIQEKATSDTEAIREQARQAGYAVGLREEQLALAQARKDLEDERISQQKCLEQERLNMIRELEPSLIQLSLQVARKIIHAELRLFPEQASKIAQSVLAQVKEPGQVILKTSSVDQNRAIPLINNSNSSSKIETMVDETLKSGDFVAQTARGVIDGTVEGQLGIIEHRLMEVARND